MNLREIDRLVAEHVMGWEKKHHHEDRCSWETIGGRIDVPKFSEDIAAAWDVVEKVCADISGGVSECILSRCDSPVSKGWVCRFGHEEASWQSGDAWSGCDTAPLAICLAALMAKNMEVPE